MFLELEYKYKADNINLTDFQALMDSIGYSKSLAVSSWDHYYTKEYSEDSFLRYRADVNAPELTQKVKTKDSNNWERIEVDLPLDSKKLSFRIVDKFVKILDYTHNFSIHKVCDIYWKDNVNFVYYVVFDKNLKELNRFIEVELNKNDLYKIEGNPMEVLGQAESLLREIGIGPKNRMKKSLFEIYKK